MYSLISRARDLYFQGSPYVTESLDFSLLVCHHKIGAQHRARSYLVVLDRLCYDDCTLVSNFVLRQVQTRASLFYQCLVHHTLHVGITESLATNTLIDWCDRFRSRWLRCPVIRRRFAMWLIFQRVFTNIRTTRQRNSSNIAETVAESLSVESCATDYPCPNIQPL